MSLGKLNKFKIGIILTAFFSVFFVLGGSKASALISGAPSNVFPDTSLAGQGASYTVVQLSNSPIKMKAASTIASIYVPKSRVGEKIDLVIADGCDNGPRDYRGGLADTYFRIGGFPLGSDRMTPAHSAYCGSGDSNLSMSFYADAAASYSSHEGNYIFRFIADAAGDEVVVGNAATSTLDGRYLNAFQVWVATPGINAGIASWTHDCNKFFFPNSCPKERDIDGRVASYTYSSFYGSSNTYGLQIPIQNTCDTYGGVSFYDLDASDQSLKDRGQDLKIWLYKGGTWNQRDGTPQTRPGAPYDYLPHVAIEKWDVGIENYLIAHSPYGGNENQYLDIPGADSSFNSLRNFDKDTPYLFLIEGVSSDNAIQVLVSLRECPDKEEPKTADNSACYSPLTKVNTPTIYPGDTFQVQVAMRNTGTTVWDNPNYRIFTASSYTDNFENPNLPYGRTGGQVTVDPTWPNVAIHPPSPGYDGWVAVFVIQGTAPSSPGNYNYNWKMDNYGTGAFGPQCGTNVVVQPRPEPVDARIDSADCNAIKGFAQDPNQPGWNIRIYLYAHGPGQSWWYAGYAESTGSSHTFTFNIPDAYKNATVYSWQANAYGWEPDGTASSSYTSTNIADMGPCDHPVQTGIDSYDCNVIKGYAYDPDQASPNVIVAIYVRVPGVTGWAHVQTIYANEPSARFTFNIPSAYRNATRYEWTGDAYGTYPSGVQATSVSTGIIGIGPCDRPVQTAIESYDCNVIKGYAYDPDQATPSVLVAIYARVPGVSGWAHVQTVVANEPNARFTFNIPEAYRNATRYEWTGDAYGTYPSGAQATSVSTGIIGIGPCIKATCSSASIANVASKVYPNNEYTVTVNMKNEGEMTWTPALWALGGENNQPVVALSSNVPTGQTATFTYTAKVPTAGSANSSFWKMSYKGNKFGPSCGVEFNVPQGRLSDAFNWNSTATRKGVINTCGWGTIGTGEDNKFTFVVQKSAGFCVALVSSEPTADSVYVRPFTTGYRDCPAYTSADSATGLKCYTSIFYGSMNSAGAVVPDQYAGIATGDGYDRNIDTGYDLALSWKPKVSCSVVNSSGGIGETIIPSVSVITGSTDGPSPKVAAGAQVSYSANNKTSTGVTTKVLGVNESEEVNLSPGFISNEATNYSASANAKWTATPYSGTTPNCAGRMRVVRQPYFKVYNADTIVGAGFNDKFITCTPSDVGQVQAYANGSTGGASTEYALIAKKLVSGMYSSSSKNTRTPDKKALTFANVSTDTWGGNFNRSGQCIKDYYELTRKVTTKFNAVDADSVEGLNAAAKDNQIGRTGNLTLSGTASAFAGKLAVYVDGDVYINGNINLSTNYSGGTSTIPFFALIVKGNIYIKETVTNLDGMYVAQPKAGAKGIVYTCASGLGSLHSNGNGTTANSSSADTQCARQLTFNGAVIAKGIKLLRTIGTVRSATASEQTAPGPNIAEVFNGMPEMYIADSPFRPDPVVNKQYDSAASLPPVL